MLLLQGWEPCSLPITGMSNFFDPGKCLGCGEEGWSGYPVHAPS